MSGAWTWMGGWSGAEDDLFQADWGTAGLAAPGNYPGIRQNVALAVDSEYVWMFGGEGALDNPSAPCCNVIGDLWRYEPATGLWTWMSGSKDQRLESSIRGTIGVAAPDNMPSARSGAVLWADSSDRLWLFGGRGFSDSLNDLWTYDKASGWWTCIDIGTDAPSYGVMGVEAASNWPPPRHSSATWLDSTGDLWLMGGALYEGIFRNDVWRYRPATGSWTWMQGTDQSGATGAPGIPGLTLPTNSPSARAGAAAWKDSEGKFWLLGGMRNTEEWPGYIPSNELWKLDPATTNWTRMAGEASNYQPTLYTESPSTLAVGPGGRTGAFSWGGQAGKLWLFGGFAGTPGIRPQVFNDLWSFDPATSAWEWDSGSNGMQSPASYGEKGVPHPDNQPPARFHGASWLDQSGRLWMFGGGTGYFRTIALNDLWLYDPASGDWTWINGSDQAGQVGVYGTIGVGQEGNTPGARTESAYWQDATGSFWLFGGYGKGGSTADGFLNDLWRYEPSTDKWTWVKGSQSPGATSSTGAQGVESQMNSPGSRAASAAWAHPSGDVYLFGGYGLDSRGIQGCLSDLWKYSPGTGNWTWIGGSLESGWQSVKGERGVPSPGVAPGGRQGAASWVDGEGNLWLVGGTADTDVYTGGFPEVWKYDVELGQWSWIQGEATPVCDSPQQITERPRGRRGAAIYGDGAWGFWLFGGHSQGCLLDDEIDLGDLWRGRFVYNLTYFAESGGLIQGNAEQTVTPGTDGTPISAQPLPGFAFVQWSDGLGTPARQDRNVTRDLRVTAIFAETTPVGGWMLMGE